MSWHDQSAYEVRVDWGADGLLALARASDAVVVVDVLSFSTCVDIAVARGAAIFPAATRNDDAVALAARLGGVCARPRSSECRSLSPQSLRHVRSGERIVLASPNGAALCLEAEAGGLPTFTACLRNAAAVAQSAAAAGRRIAVIAAGERWPSGALRPALEDWLGAGAVVAHLGGRRSPEADAACRAFDAAAPRIETVLGECVSGRELVERGFAGDVTIAAELGTSACAPRLQCGVMAGAAAFVADGK